LNIEKKEKNRLSPFLDNASIIISGGGHPAPDFEGIGIILEKNNGNDWEAKQGDIY
jgi:hypothetical protein